MIRPPWTLALHSLTGQPRTANTTFRRRFWTRREAWRAAKAQNHLLRPDLMWLPKKGESW